jgi:hypothetical protein
VTTITNWNIVESGIILSTYISITYPSRGHRGHECMVVGFTTTFAISAYHHWCEFESRSGWGVQHYVIFCQWLTTGRWFSPPIKLTVYKLKGQRFTQLLQYTSLRASVLLTCRKHLVDCIISLREEQGLGP